MITLTNNTVFELSSLWLEVTFAGELVNFHLVGVGEKLGNKARQDQWRCENNRKRVSELLMSFWRYRQIACGICFLAYPTTLLVGKTPNEIKRKPGKCIAGQAEIMQCQRCRQKCLEFARSHSHTQLLKKDTNQVNKSEYENVHNRSCVFGPRTAYLHSNFECVPCGWI